MEVIVHWCRAHRKRLERLGWVVAEALIASGVGLLVAMLYLRGR